MSAGKSDVLLARERAEWLRSLAASDKPSDLSPKRPDERLALADLLTRMADALAAREADVALLGRAEEALAERVAIEDGAPLYDSAHVLEAHRRDSDAAMRAALAALAAR